MITALAACAANSPITWPEVVLYSVVIVVVVVVGAAALAVFAWAVFR